MIQLKAKTYTESTEHIQKAKLLGEKMGQCWIRPHAWLQKGTRAHARVLFPLS
jgi:hypothetical protein